MWLALGDSDCADARCRCYCESDRWWIERITVRWLNKDGICALCVLQIRDWEGYTTNAEEKVDSWLVTVWYKQHPLHFTESPCFAYEMLRNPETRRSTSWRCVTIVKSEWAWTWWTSFLQLQKFYTHDLMADCARLNISPTTQDSLMTDWYFQTRKHLTTILTM